MRSVPERRTSRGFSAASELLGRKIVAVRQMRRMTQEDLAHRSGLSRNQVQNIERNRNNTRDPESGRPGPANARLDTIYLIADALQVEVTWLIDRRDADLRPPSERVETPRS